MVTLTGAPAPALLPSWLCTHTPEWPAAAFRSARAADISVLPDRPQGFGWARARGAHPALFPWCQLPEKLLVPDLPQIGPPSGVPNLFLINPLSVGRRGPAMLLNVSLKRPPRRVLPFHAMVILSWSRGRLPRLREAPLGRKEVGCRLHSAPSVPVDAPRGSQILCLQTCAARSRPWGLVAVAHGG